MKSFWLGLLSGIVPSIAVIAWIIKSIARYNRLSKTLINVITENIDYPLTGYSYQLNNDDHLIRLCIVREVTTHEADDDKPESTSELSVDPVIHGKYDGKSVTIFSEDEWKLAIMQAVLDGTMTDTGNPLVNVFSINSNTVLFRILEPNMEEERLEAIAHGVKDGKGLRLISDMEWATRGGLDYLHEYGNPKMAFVKYDEDYDEDDDDYED